MVARLHRDLFDAPMQKRLLIDVPRRPGLPTVVFNGWVLKAT